MIQDKHLIANAGPVSGWLHSVVAGCIADVSETFTVCRQGQVGPWWYSADPTSRWELLRSSEVLRNVGSTAHMYYHP
jgi:hypothetical protein